MAEDEGTMPASTFFLAGKTGDAISIRVSTTNARKSFFSNDSCL